MARNLIHGKHLRINELDLTIDPYDGYLSINALLPKASHPFFCRNEWTRLAMDDEVRIFEYKVPTDASGTSFYQKNHPSGSPSAHLMFHPMEGSSEKPQGHQGSKLRMTMV